MIWAFELRVMQSDRSAHWRRLLVAATAAVSCAATVAFAQVATESAERANAQGATSEAIEPAQSAQPTTDTARPRTPPRTLTPIAWWNMSRVNPFQRIFPCPSPSIFNRDRSRL